ncbi:MAG TPA: sugar ABC transporter permease [Clostridiaceae bacterium]|nr:sugar ABC transporter permease [Clostridiaceae bacterium]HHV99096.1 sugar ABC transporter permease [Clostridiaceae bacterium]
MVGESRLSKGLVILTFLLPSLIGLILFNIIPIISSAFMSFTDWDMLTNPKFVGFQNYYNVFFNENSIKSIVNTLKYVVGFTPLVICFGLMLAILLNIKITGLDVYRVIFFMPVVISWVVVSLIWIWLYSPDSGIINYLLSLIGINGPAWLQNEHTAMPAVIIASLWKDVGFAAVILLSGLQNIPDEYYESAEIDGANSIKKLFYITLPCLTPILFFLIVTSLITSFQVFDQVFIMTKGGPFGSTRTIVQEIYENAFQMGKVGFACAQAWLLVVIILVVTLVQNILQKRWVHYESK